MASATPPPYARTVFDETHRSISYSQGSIASMAIRPSLLGYLVNHSPDTDGSFSICMAGGIGTFISQSLFESIPSEHRPALDTSAAGQSIELLMGGPMTSIGTTFLPFILTTTTGERIRLILHALVLPNLFMGMFIGRGGLTWLESEAWGPSTNGPRYTFDFGQTGRVEVQGI